MSKVKGQMVSAEAICTLWIIFVLDCCCENVHLFSNSNIDPSASRGVVPHGCWTCTFLLNLNKYMVTTSQSGIYQTSTTELWHEYKQNCYHEKCTRNVIGCHVELISADYPPIKLKTGADNSTAPSSSHLAVCMRVCDGIGWDRKWGWKQRLSSLPAG